MTLKDSYMEKRKRNSDKGVLERMGRDGTPPRPMQCSLPVVNHSRPWFRLYLGGKKDEVKL